MPRGFWKGTWVPLGKGYILKVGAEGCFLCYLRYSKDVCIYDFASFFQNICKLFNFINK